MSATMNSSLSDEAAGAFRLLIDGMLVAGVRSFDVINPATERVLASCPCADKAQLDRAVAAAKAAYPTWSMRPIAERRRLLMQVADELAARSTALARLLTQEQGKPLIQARREIERSAGMIKAFAAMDLPDTVLKEAENVRIVQQRAPLGVVAAITPWNLPIILLMSKFAPALLAGNTLVIKPAPTTPLTTLRFGEICAQVLPPGVVNVITDMNDLGDALTGHPDVAKVAFTGSTATGRKVMASAAATVKRLTLELGGNDAAIVLSDAVVKDVAAKVFNGAMGNSGQVCLAIKRVYAPDSMYDELCRELAKLAEAAVVGDGLDERTEIGPLQNKAQFERVQGFVEDARAHGKIIAGGTPPQGPGYFVRPTIVRDIPDDARLVREEQFGPVLPVLRYSDLDDAIARANDSEYGLGATVWGTNLERAYEVASKIHSGTVWINKHLELRPDVPFAGAKQSGHGTELGHEGLEEFTQVRIINMAR
jgi:acyl-CoA reductase-like NAD-dependent aldehyde dehydrogenase